MHLRGQLRQKTLRQPKNVARSITKRRDGQADDVDSVVQVLPKASLLHQSTKILVRGADQSHVYVDPFFPAQSLDASFLKDPKQVDLG